MQLKAKQNRGGISGSHDKTGKLKGLIKEGSKLDRTIAMSE